MACQAEDVTKRRLEEPITILFIDLDITFTQEQIRNFKEGWKQGLSLEKISEIIRPRDKNRDNAEFETFLLCAELSRKGKIEPREVK